jgi:hypothetical protein
MLSTLVYSDGAPALLEQLAKAPEMQRLSGVGMHCGCEYSGIPFYKRSMPYDRLMHSVGVAKIIWHFTKDIRQAAAGMFHDIATPVFAHTIDFMNNDYITQESTEGKTASFIKGSESIMSLLSKNDIAIDDISDYQKYPIADNETPMLSADRLEYTLGNGYTVYHLEIGKIKEIYDDLSVAKNEHGSEELCFRSVEMAKEFVGISLRNSRFYVSNEDRFLMQCLADIVRSAIKAGVLTLDDLHSTEREVIGKLRESYELSAAWDKYTGISAVAESEEELRDRYCVKVFAKKRYIVPLVQAKGGAKRVSEIDAGLKMEIEEFLRLDFSKWLYAV